VFQAASRRIDSLLAREREVKKRGEWGEVDLYEYTSAVLRDVDRIVYSPDDFRDYIHVEEVYGYVQVGERHVAVACRDEEGIYEVEKRLKQRWGDQLGIVALEKEPGQFTLRRAAALADIDLSDAYEKLNLLDPNVDGSPPGKRWGGSDDIGGSPRPSGTALGPRELLQILGLAYRPVTGWQRGRRLGAATLLAAAFVLLTGVLAVLAAIPPRIPPAPTTEAALRLAAVAAAALGLGALMVPFFSERRAWLYGVRRPAGWGWLALAPLVLAAALPARVWGPRELSLDPTGLAAVVGSVALFALALELWFRGLVHGAFLLQSPVQSPAGRWFVSRPALVSGLLYGLVLGGAAVPRAAFSRVPFPVTWVDVTEVTGAAVLSGIALAMMRERSLSLWPGVGIHVVAALVGIALGTRLGF